MRSQRMLLSAFLALLALCSLADAQDTRFTIQVGAFSDRSSAQAFIVQLARAGENPMSGEIEIPGHGKLVRVLIGSFSSQAKARKRGQNLMARAIIKEFFVKPADETIPLIRVSSSIAISSESPGSNKKEGSAAGANRNVLASVAATRKPDAPSFPMVRSSVAELIPRSSALCLPAPDPVRLAFRLIAGRLQATDTGREGGLWLAGDRVEGIRRLRWIAGLDEEMVEIYPDGRVRLNVRLLAKAAGIDDAGCEASLKALHYISSNEGLLLLAQLTEGNARYLLHIGADAPTLGDRVEVGGSINLDNNYDSRINPHRRQGMKLDRERPPSGFDSMIAMRPSAQWVNLRTGRLVPVAHITFHELAEAYAKVTLGLQYLGEGLTPGAHNLALDREEVLSRQRPLSNLVTTTGANRVLRTEEELRQFQSESGITGNQR